MIQNQSKMFVIIVSLLKSQMKATNTVQNLDPIEDEILQSFIVTRISPKLEIIIAQRKI